MLGLNLEGKKTVILKDYILKSLLPFGSILYIYLPTSDFGGMLSCMLGHCPLATQQDLSMWEPSLPFHLCFKDECHAHCHGARFEPNLMLVFKGQENCLFSFSSSSSSFSLPSSFLKTKLSTSLENNPHLTLKLDDSLTFRALELQIKLNCFCLKFAASAPGCCLLTQLKPVLCEEKVLLSLPTASLAGQTGDWN